MFAPVWSATRSRKVSSPAIGRGRSQLLVVDGPSSSASAPRSAACRIAGLTSYVSIGVRRRHAPMIRRPRTRRGVPKSPGSPVVQQGCAVPLDTLCDRLIDERLDVSIGYDSGEVETPQCFAAFVPPRVLLLHHELDELPGLARVLRLYAFEWGV
jgi:hypothetical protein